MVPLPERLPEFASVMEAYDWVLKNRPTPPFRCRIKGYETPFTFYKHDAQFGASKHFGWLWTNKLEDEPSVQFQESPGALR